MSLDFRVFKLDTNQSVKLARVLKFFILNQNRDSLLVTYQINNSVAVTGVGGGGGN